MVSAASYLGLALITSATIFASSAEFVLYSNNNNLTFPLTNYQELRYNEDGVIGQFDNCDKCYNFSNLITDEGYIEIVETSAGEISQSLYFTIDETTGRVTVNETASTDPFTISTHLLYYNSSLRFALVEQELNETYYLYFLGGPTKISSIYYPTTLNTAFRNGSRYLYYAPDEASVSHSVSKLSHIPNTISTTASSTADAATTSSSSSKANAGSLNNHEKGFPGVIAVILGWAAVFGI